MSRRHVEAPSAKVEIGNTPAETQAALALVFSLVAGGEMDHVVGRELSQMIKTRLGYYKLEHDTSEIERLKELVRQAQEVHDAGLIRETEDRQHTAATKA